MDGRWFTKAKRNLIYATPNADMWQISLCFNEQAREEARISGFSDDVMQWSVEKLSAPPSDFIKHRTLIFLNNGTAQVVNFTSCLYYKFFVFVN